MTQKEFILKWTNRISSEGIKKFPDEFILSDETEELNLPEKTLLIGEEFFGNYEILTVEGSEVMKVENHDKAKFIIYANRTKPSRINIPKNISDIKLAVNDYGKYLASIIKRIEMDYKREFQAGKNSKAVTNEIFRILNLVRY